MSDRCWYLFALHVHAHIRVSPIRVGVSGARGLCRLVLCELTRCRFSSRQHWPGLPNSQLRSSSLWARGTEALLGVTQATSGAARRQARLPGPTLPLVHAKHSVCSAANANSNRKPPLSPLPMQVAPQRRIAHAVSLQQSRKLCLCLSMKTGAESVVPHCWLAILFYTSRA